MISAITIGGIGKGEEADEFRQWYVVSEKGLHRVGGKRVQIQRQVTGRKRVVALSEGAGRGSRACHIRDRRSYSRDYPLYYRSDHYQH